VSLDASSGACAYSYDGVRHRLASAIDDSPATRVASQGAKPRPTITVDLGASPKLARRALDVIAAETADAVTPGSSELVI
jgi:hypothetical protein